jgi:hypothetical protein
LPVLIPIATSVTVAEGLIIFDGLMVPLWPGKIMTRLTATPTARHFYLPVIEE